MNTDSLREHLIYLSTRAHPDVLVKAVRLLEAAKVSDGGGVAEMDAIESSLQITHIMDPNPLQTDGGILESMGFNVETAANERQDEDVVKTMTKQRSMRGRRIAVSAEPMKPDVSEHFAPRRVEKSPEQLGQLRKMVALCHLFAAMDVDEQDVIVYALEKDEFSAGHEILTQGEPPKTPKFYIILEGTCEVIKNGKPVASLSSGNFFGELEIMYARKECEATVRTVTDCVMYAMDQHTYKNIVYKVSMEKKEKYLDLVQNVSFLEAMSDYDKKSFAEALVTSRYSEGETIITFGEKGLWMHIIVDGVVSVVGRDKGERTHVIDLTAGDVVGELEFLFDHPCIADVLAKTDVITAKINRKHFEMLLGKITPELKHFVAKKGNYAHYLKAADDAVKREIHTIERRAVKTTATTAVMENVEKGGELVLSYDFPNKKVNPLCRFALKPAAFCPTLMVGLREDATIVYWNDAIERLTDFAAEEVLGQSFYSLIFTQRDQQAFQQQLGVANSWAGNVGDDFYADAVATKREQYTMHRRDGLAKVAVQLAFIPPTFSHGKDVAEILLAVGTEVRSNVSIQQDFTTWLSEKVRSTISSPELDGDSKLSQIGEALSKFEMLQNRAVQSHTENLNIMNVRQLIGQVVMDYAQRCIEKGINVTQDFSMLSVEELYVDSDVLPNCLRVAMNNAANHLPNGSTVKILVSVEEEYGAEYLQITFHDNGPGVPAKVLDNFAHDVESSVLIRTKAKLKRVGGEMALASEPGKTVVSFRFPFLPSDTHENMMDLASSTTQRSDTYTSLVVEDRSARRNMLCAFLWERKHAVLPGYSAMDVQRLREQVDLIFIDPKQSVFTEMDNPWTHFRETARTVAVILTGEKLDAELRTAAKLAGFLTLQYPCNSIQAAQVFRKAEEKISRIKAERERVNQSREMLQKMKHAAWTRGALLGKGTFGNVYEAIDTLTGGRMAVKVIRIDDAKYNKEEMINEIRVMCTLQHPHIIHYFFCDEDTENGVLNVLMEYAGGGTLAGMLEKKGQLEFDEYVRILREVVLGVAYIHSQRFVHCDLKTANVLISNDGKCKLGDFGTTHRLAEGEERYIPEGTFLYMSPECLSAGEVNEETGEKVGFSFPADIWSLGCIALEMATGKPPFAYLGLNQTALVNYICNLHDIPDLSPLFDDHPAIIEFVSACLKVNPKERFTAEALLNLNLFQEGAEEDLATALKALRRAQLLSVLERFVAFQEPDDAEEARRNAERFRTRRNDDPSSSPNQRLQEEDSFFADSEEQSCGTETAENSTSAMQQPVADSKLGTTSRSDVESKVGGSEGTSRPGLNRSRSNLFPQMREQLPLDRTTSILRSTRRTEVLVPTGDPSTISSRRGAAAVDDKLIRMASLASMRKRASPSAVENDEERPKESPTVQYEDVPVVTESSDVSMSRPGLPTDLEAPVSRSLDKSSNPSAAATVVEQLFAQLSLPTPPTDAPVWPGRPNGAAAADEAAAEKPATLPLVSTAGPEMRAPRPPAKESDARPMRQFSSSPAAAAALPRSNGVARGEAGDGRRSGEKKEGETGVTHIRVSGGRSLFSVADRTSQSRFPFSGKGGLKMSRAERLPFPSSISGAKSSGGVPPLDFRKLPISERDRLVLMLHHQWLLLAEQLLFSPLHPLRPAVLSELQTQYRHLQGPPPPNLASLLRDDATLISAVFHALGGRGMVES